MSPNKKSPLNIKNIQRAFFNLVAMQESIGSGFQDVTFCIPPNAMSIGGIAAFDLPTWKPDPNLCTK